MRKDINRYRRQSLCVVIALLLLTQWNRPAVKAQHENFFRSPGKEISEGSNTIPVGDGEMKVISYYLEEIVPAKPIEKVSMSEVGKPLPPVGLDRQAPVRVERVLRLTIKGEFPSGNYIIWVGDQPSREGVDYSPKKLTTIFYFTGLNSISPFEEGATLAVSRYTGKNDLRAPRTVLPDRLHLPAHLQFGRISPADVGSMIKSINRVSSSNQLLGQPGIEIEFTRKLPFEILNTTLVLQIGLEEFFLSYHPTGDLKSVIFTLTPEEFARLKDGDKVILKWGTGAVPGMNYGLLNKSLLNR